MRKLKDENEKLKVVNRLYRVFLILFFHFSLFTFNLYACPMCGDILERGKDAVKAFKFSSGIAWSILLMLAVPYLLVGGTIFVIWKSYQNKKKQENHASKK